jgi:hypothetical protein
VRARAICVVAAIGWFAGAPRASADHSSVSGVIAIGGDAEERDRAAVTAGITAATRGAGWQLPARPLSKKEATGLLRCLEPGEPWECIPGTIGAQGIHHALVVAAQKQQADDGSPLVVLTAKLIVTSPHALVVQQRFCERCSDDKLAQASAELAQQLVQELAVRIGRTVLEIRSTPSGARITLDGVAVGATDTTFNTYPGAHIVILEKPGYLSQTIRVDVQEGKTADVSAALRSSRDAGGGGGGASSTTQPPPPPSRVVPWALISAGGVAVVTGGALIYLGQQDGPDDKTIHRRATALGIATGIAGAAAIGAGAYLLLRTPDASAPTIIAVPGGAVIGWARRF